MERSFKNFGALASHFEKAVDNIHRNGPIALEQIGRRVEVLAKSKLGEYQPGWVGLADSTLADKVLGGWPIPSPLLRTGEMRETIHHTVYEKAAVIGSDSQIAVWQEMGTSKMPARSFLGSSMIDTREQNVETIQEVAVIKSFRE